MDRLARQLSPERLLADSRWLRSLARGLAGEERADDLAQETWLSFLMRPPRFLANLRPWLRTVARNRAFREGEREAQRPEREARAARPEAQPAADDLVARATLRRTVVDAVLELAEPYRTTVLLRFFEELPPREVARRQGIPVATVRTRIARALEQLRVRLDRENGGQRAWLALLVPVKGLLDAGLLTGAVVMGTKAKVACAGVVAVLAAVGWWGWLQVSGPPASAGSMGQSPVPSESRPLAGVASPAVVVGPAPASAPIRPRPFREEAGAEFAITGVAVDDRTGQPVEGVAARAVWHWKPETVPPDAATDREGKFRISLRDTNQLRGVVLLSPEHAPLVLDHLENDVHRAGGGPLDVGTVRLLRGARVSGRVVRAETREPVANAQLFVSPRGYPVTQLLLAEARPVGRSGSDGTFILTERVPPPPPRWDREAILTAVIPDGVGWTLISVVNDRETLDGVEIVVARGASLRVAVVDEDEKPVEGALVHAVPRFAPLGPPRQLGREYADGHVQEAVRDHFAQKTGPDGTAAFRGLPIGRTDERFQQYSSSPGAYSVGAYHASYVMGEPTGVEVDPAAEISATVKLVRRTLCTVRGRITTDTGSPIEGARVEVRGEGVIATTDRDGAYRAEGRDTAYGRIYVEVHAQGCATCFRTVELPSKPEDVVADFVLQKSAPIAGRVIDQDGRPVPRAYVDIHEGVGQGMRQLRPDGGGDLDAEGRFVFSDATAGPWTLRVHSPEPYEDWSSPRDRIVQGGDRNLEVVLRRRPAGRARLDAEVVDLGSGAALDPAETRLLMAAPATFSYDHLAGAATQRSAGRVTAEKLRPGRWSLFVRMADGRRVTKDFVVKPEDDVVKLRIEIGTPGTVIVRIDRSAIPEDGRPSAVHAWTNPGDAVQWMSKPGVKAPRCTRGFGTADQSNDWTVLFGDVTPGVPIRFWITNQDGKACHAEATVTVGFGEEKELVLRPAVCASVTFRKPDQAPAGGVIVSVRGPDGTWSPVNWSNIWEDGKEWKVERRVIPGHVVWRAERYDLDADPVERVPLATVQGELDLAAGDAREVPIVFPK